MKKKGKQKIIEFPSELRMDLVSRDWVIIATGRAKRPELFKKEKRKVEELSKEKCPFCHIETQKPPKLIYSHGRKVSFREGDKIPPNWTTVVIPNKYPAVLPYHSLQKTKEGNLYQKMNAVGFHEVVVTRNHTKPVAKLSVEETKELLDVFHQRYLALMRKKFVNYISIFQNHGVEAGASIPHPHFQIITTPLIDPDLRRALNNAKKYFRRHRECVYCLMNQWERKTQERLVFENEGFQIVCPFASKQAFEMIISPKEHLSYFERITEKQKWLLAEAFKVALEKLYRGLGDPAYNLYLHTAPCDGRDYSFYHWHWTILPKTGAIAGFEVGTKMEISTIEPEKAAQYLRKQKVQI